MANVSLKEIRKAFGKLEVIHGITCEIRDGEFVVVVGPSGCGKSTMLRMIAGLERVTAGEISIGGRVVNELEPKERDVAMVFQSYALYPHMTVFKNMAYSLRIARRPKAEIRKRVLGVAKTLELEELLERKPSQLSGGQRQRVAMGRAIIREPQVFLFDEPLSNLDAQLRVQMRVEIKRLHKQLGATSIFVTHDQVEAMTMADTLVVMRDGDIEQVGTPKEVYRRPATQFVAGFMGAPATNFLPGRIAADGRSVDLLEKINLKLGSRVSDDMQGQPVTIGIRPEHIRLASKNRRAGIPVHLELIEELGSGRLLHTSVDGHGLVVSIPAEEEEQDDPAESLFLSVAPQNLHLFHPDSGKRLEA
jgi:sn-glycerol 3-phosphate transport system ATP-binding protein